MSSRLWAKELQLTNKGSSISLISNNYDPVKSIIIFNDLQVFKLYLDYVTCALLSRIKTFTFKKKLKYFFHFAKELTKTRL